jgi:maleate isomerase
MRPVDGPQVAFEPSGPPRVGLIALSTDLTSERDAAQLLPPAGIAMHTTRVAFENPTTPESLRRMQPLLADAARLILPGIPLAAIWYSCTAASAILGDAAVDEAVSAGRPGVPVVTPPAAAVDAFARLGVRRIAVLTPYLPETAEGLTRYFRARGLEVVAATSLGLEDDRDMARVAGASIRAAAASADRPEAEALFVSCTALPAVAQVAAIEEALGKPVVTSNQASLWALGHHAGLPVAVPGRLGAVGVAPA